MTNVITVSHNPPLTLAFYDFMTNQTSKVEVRENQFALRSNNELKFS